MHSEVERRTLSGWAMLLPVFLVLAIGLAVLITGDNLNRPWLCVAAAPVILFGGLCITRERT